MSNRYRDEPDVPLHVTFQHICDARCGDPTRCTLALAGFDAVGHAVTAEYEEDTGDVRVLWEANGEDGRLRVHRGYLAPLKTAMWLLYLTDTNKRKLVRKRPDGFELTIERHESAVKQVRSQETIDAERERRADLERRRALPPDHPDWEPPAIRRASGGKPSRAATGTRFHPTPSRKSRRGRAA
jgi:hypothetical protein